MGMGIKLGAVLVVLALLTAGGALAVLSLAQGDPPEVVTLTPDSGGRVLTPGPSVEQDEGALWPDEERRARAAALRITGGGRVSEVDRSDDPGEAYEVEVIKDGREYDIALDLDFEQVPNRRFDD
jgi:hypothetical protein